MADDKNLIVPLKAGEVSIATHKQLDAMLDDTVGRSSGLLDGLTVFRQGKEDYFNVGDEKRGTVLGIFMLSRRPNRACWEKEELSGDAPACFSFDGITPHSSIAKPFAAKCDGCPFDKPGSGKGNSKKCKQKASDFILLLRDKIQYTEDRSTAFVTKDDIIGPGLVNFSIGNRGSSAAYQEWLRTCKEKGVRPQGCVTRWSFGEDESKSGVTYNFVKQEYVAMIAGPENDPDLWNVIVKAVMDLKSGSADNILFALTGSAKADD